MKTVKTVFSFYKYVNIIIRCSGKTRMISER